MDRILDEVLLLTSAKREGEYWDFKEKYHTNKADLLHDIICMANNRADKDGYIIFGISDNYEIKGITDDGNRKNQQNLIDFIKSKKFSGGVRPTVELRTFMLDNHEIDVVIVKNNTDTPYFLIENFDDGKRRVRANHIYTRIGDTNTDIDKSADINHIEYLWKKRFLLNRPPMEQAKQKLRSKEEWVEADNGYYHIFNPEYKLTLEYDEGAGLPAFYSYLMYNDSTSYGTLTLKYFETKLYSTEIAVLDGGRYTTPTPSWGSIGNRYGVEKSYLYKYFLQDSLDFVMHRFLLDDENPEEKSARDMLYSAIVLYKNEMEKKLFEEYLNSNIPLLEDLIEKESQSYEWIDGGTQQGRTHTIEQIGVGIAVKRLFALYKEQLSSIG